MVGMGKTVEMTLKINLAVDEETCLRKLQGALRCIRWSLTGWGLVRGVTIGMPKIAGEQDGLVDYLTEVFPR